MSHVPDHVQNPSAWLDAKDRRIKANARKTKRAQLLAAIENDGEEFTAWLLDGVPAYLDALRGSAQDAYDADDYEANERLYAEYHEAVKQWRKRVGYVPQALRTALDEWGGLTEKQLAWARSAFAKNVARAEQRDADELARKSSAPSWVAGRQTVSGTIQFTRCEDGQIGYRTTFAIKAIVLLDDGRKCWTSIPRAMWPGDGTGGASLKGERITFTATFSPSDDDPTMAFAKRPTLAKASSAVESSELTETPAEGAIVDSSASETPQQAKARRARERRERRKREQNG